MNSFFNYDGPFFNVLNRISDLVILNVLWFICCLPIVTIGASTTALYYVTIKIVNEEDAYVAKNFFKSFKENFVQSTIIWLILGAFGAAVVWDFFLLPNQISPESPLYTGLFSVLCLAGFLTLLVLVWVFPLQARLENKIRHTFKNAVLLGFRHLPTTLLLMVILVACVWFALTFAGLFFIWVIVGAAAVVYGCSFLVDKILKLYIKPEDLNPYPQEEESENGEKEE